jgi:glucoamylase
MEPRGSRIAPGAPGMAPRWSHSNKDGVGTAYSADSRLWYTVWRGIVTEVYFPTIDRPQLRDLELLFTDGTTFFHEEKRHLRSAVERPQEHGLGYRVRSESPDGRYRVVKDILADPHLPCLLMRVRVEIEDPVLRGRLRVFVLAAPHLDVGGWDNSATVYRVLGQPILAAEKSGVAAAVGATRPFARASVGYVGASDGWTQLNAERDLAQEYDLAPLGNVALTGEIPLDEGGEFTVGLAFGASISGAVTTLFQSLDTPFEVHHRRFQEQWNRTGAHELPIAGPAHDGGRLYRASRAMLLAHEDKIFPGAFIASLSIPWGASKGDEDRGGYHLVWVRDMVQTASALLASGSTEAPLRALVYLATRQQPDGGFPQNFWVDGEPYWSGIQLDEVAFPLLLAGRLRDLNALAQFDPIPLIRSATRFLIEHGPVTEQDRWEEVSGYSPSTLAISIAALTVASGIARERGQTAVAQFTQEYADFLEQHVERWTVTEAGTLVPGIRRHYVRIRPVSIESTAPDEGAGLGMVRLPNLPPGEPEMVQAAEVVDGGFLDLVRYGIRSPDDPLIVDSIRVIDRVLKVDTPLGPVWRRYNHDGYGTRDDGGPYDGWGRGRAWPLLTGERGHYELCAGRDPAPYLRAMERFATSTGLLPEQVWDEPDRPALHLELGRPTESAVPLVWAHAEYVKLLRSATDGRVYDLLPEVEHRYRKGIGARRRLEVWKFNHQVREIAVGDELRIIATAPFVLHASSDDWSTLSDVPSTPTPLGLHFVDLAPLTAAGATWRFTFRWVLDDRWEGRDFAVAASEAVYRPRAEEPPRGAHSTRSHRLETK